VTADEEASAPGQTTSARGDEDARGETSLTSATISGGAWRTVSVFGGAVMQFAVTIVLARILTPTDFGTFGLVMIVVGLASMPAFLGLSSALVQRRSILAVHVRTAWTLSLITGVIACAFIALTAPLLSRLVGDPSTTYVFMAISPAFLLSGIRTCSVALLRRDLRFRELTIVDVASYSIGYAVVGIAAALLGWGLWSLVAASLCEAAIGTVLSYAYERHSLRLGLSAKAFRQLFGFGGPVSASGVANYVALNADNFIIGRVLGPAALGLYARAYNLMNLPLIYFAGIMGSVLLPAFSRIQDDRERMKRSYLVSVYLIFLFSAPTMMFVLIAAPDIIIGIYGHRWTGAIRPLQVLALFGALRATYHVGGILAQGAGRPWSEFARQLMYAGLVAVGALVGTKWGITGVAWAVGIAIIAMYIATAQLSRTVTGFGWGDFMSAHRSGAAAGGAVLLVLSGCRWLLLQTALPALPALVALVAAFGVTTLAAIATLPKRWGPEGHEYVLTVACGKLPKPVREIAKRIVLARDA